MRIKSMAACICMAALIVGASLFAHDTWLIPSTFHCNPGESISVDIATGMEFPASEGPVAKTRVHNCVAIHGQLNLQPVDYAEANDALRANFMMPSEENSSGTWVVLCSLNPSLIELGAEDFNEYLLHDGLKRVYELRKRESMLEMDAVEQYSKHAKTLVQVGNIIDDSPTRPFGQIIEIVPAVNPYSLKQGDSLAVTVLFRGEPLAGAEVAWTYDGKEGFAGSTMCDEKGVAKIPLEKAQAILIRTIDMEHVKQPDYEWESNWASLTFEVPGH